MPFDVRRALRLHGYDYSQAGAYFVTICVRRRASLFGQLVDGEMELNEVGRIVRATWDGLPGHYADVVLDAFVVMPNHVHGIIVLHDPGGLGSTRVSKAAAAHRRGLPEVVRGFKTYSARSINAVNNMPGRAVWQRNYYEHVIRDEKSLDCIREYIAGNPARWSTDPENPKATTSEDVDWMP